MLLTGVLIALGLGVLAGWALRASRSAVAFERLRLAHEMSEGEIRHLREQVQRGSTEQERLRAAEQAARERAAALEARAQAEREAHAGAVAALAQMGEEVRTAFQGLAADALHKNNEQFLHLAETAMRHQKAEAAGDLEARRSAIDQLLTPMRESLARLNDYSRELEVKREGAYEAIRGQIEGMQAAHGDLRRETSQLVQALRAPRVRGTWGEMQLRRCVEFSGMVEHASFETQKFVRGESESYRPDLVVHLPSGQCVVVDAKTPLDAFLAAAECEDETQRLGHYARHASRVRKHLEELSQKAYWRQFRASPDLVVCFLPSEVLFSAALEHDAALLEHSARSKVILASPTTLITLLKTVAYGWQQSKIARDADMIRQEAQSVHAKLAGMHASLQKLGRSLRAAGESYDDLLVKAEGRGGLFTLARRLRELEIGQEDLPESRPVALRPRVMASDDWQGGLSLAAGGGEPEERTSLFQAGD